MFCSYCGRENNERDKFCIGCGACLEKKVVENTVVNKVKDNKSEDLNNNLFNLIKTVLIIGGIIILICFVVAFFSIFLVVKKENKSSIIGVNNYMCYNVCGDINEIYL